MRKIIFKPVLLLFLSSVAIFSCNKKQIASRSYEDIKWHSNTAVPMAKAAESNFPKESAQTEIVVKDEATKVAFTEEVKTTNFSSMDLPVALEEKSDLKITRNEKKQLKRELKEAFQTTETEMSTLLLVIIAILLPPLAVGLVRGFTSGAFFLNILLWLLFYIPGLIHALIVVLGNNK